MKSKKFITLTSCCIASGIIAIPLVSWAIHAKLNEETPILDDEYLIVEDGVLKGINWGKTTERGKITMDLIRTVGFNTLEIPENVVEIAPYAFAYVFDGVTNRVINVDFSKATNLAKIGNGAFNYCYGLESDLDFSAHENLVSIGDEAFFYCTRLKNLKLPENFEAIGDYAFFQNEGLTSLFFPNGLKTIGDHAFDSCFNLNNINLLNFNSIPKFLWTGSWIFNNAGTSSRKAPTVNVDFSTNDQEDWESALVLHQQLPNVWQIEAEEAKSTSDTDFTYDESDRSIITGLTNLAKQQIDNFETIHIPDGITEIKENAFKGIFNNSTTIKNLILNDDLKTIGNSAFEGCNNLVGTLKLPTGLTGLGSQTFMNCSNLTGNITIPKGVVELKDRVFAYSGINSVKFHDKVNVDNTKIGKQLFYNCPNLSLIDMTCYGYGALPEWDVAEKDEDKPFYGTDLSNGIILIPDNATPQVIVEQHVAFMNTYGLKDHINAWGEYDINKWKTQLLSNVYNVEFPQTTYEKSYVLYKNEIKSLTNKFKDNQKKKEFGIIATPAEATSIGENAFAKEFNSSAFSNNFWRLQLNTGLIEIKKQAFEGNNRLIDSLVIPTTVTDIGESAFSGCDHFSGLLKLPKSIESIQTQAFANTNFHTIIIPPSSSTIASKAFIANSATKNLVFTNFNSSTNNFANDFITFKTGTKGTIWAINSDQKTALQAYLDSTKSQTGWNSTNWPVKVLGEEK